MARLARAPSGTVQSAESRDSSRLFFLEDSPRLRSKKSRWLSTQQAGRPAPRPKAEKRVCLVAAGTVRKIRPRSGGCESHDSEDYGRTVPDPLVQYIPNPGALGALIISIPPIQDLSGNRCTAL